MPSDTQQFLSPDAAAKNILAGEYSAKILPSESSAWFARAADDVLGLVRQAEQRVGEHRNKEFVSTMVDLRMLAHLASYHAWRAKAGVSWALYKRSNSLGPLNDAIRYETQAVAAWQRMVEAAGDVYHDDIMMGRRGSDLSGHWRDELAKLKSGLEKLQLEQENYRPGTAEDAPWIAHVPIRGMTPGKELVIRATVNSGDETARVRVGYRCGEGDPRYGDMKRIGRYLYGVKIPKETIGKGLTYFIEAIDASNRKATYPPGGAESPISVIVSEDRDAPSVLHKPIISSPAEKPLKVTATVRDPAGVKWVRLRYRSVNQHQDYQKLDMLPTGSNDEYSAVVPDEYLVPKWDFMYLIEVMDNHGNGMIYPDLEKEMPYVVVKLKR